MALVLVMSLTIHGAMSGTIYGAGGWGGDALYQAWGAGYKYARDNTDVSYASVGSYEGIGQYEEGEVDFFSSDGGVSSDEYLQMPVAAVPFVVAHSNNIMPTGKKLVITGQILAKMWTGEVSTWCDSSIQALNPNMRGGGDINIIYHPSAAGTSQIARRAMLTFYPKLSSFINDTTEDWESVLPPYAQGRMIECSDLEQVASLLSQSSSSIAILPYPYAVARSLRISSMKNRAGQVVDPSADSVQAAMDDFAGAISVSVETVIDLFNGAGAASWPMPVFIYASLRQNATLEDCTPVDHMLSFLGWAMLNDEASAVANQLGYATQPGKIKRKVIDLMGTCECNGHRSFTTAMIIGEGTEVPIFLEWANNYQVAYKQGSTIGVKYTITGGPTSKADIIRGDIDFGAVNSDLKPEEKALAPDVRVIPVGAYPVVIAYNIPEIQDDDADYLVLNIAVLVNIFLNQVTRWNDPAIVALNPGVPLPDKEILIVLKDGSTINTGAFSKALSLASPLFASTVGQGNQVKYPVLKTNRTLLTSNDDFIVSMIKETPYAMAYWTYYETRYLKNLKVASMVNPSGNVVRPNMVSCLGAVEDSALVHAVITRDTFLVLGNGTKSWPINNYVFFVVHMWEMKDADKARELTNWIYWTQTSDQAAGLAQSIGIYPLSDVKVLWGRTLGTLVNVTSSGKYVSPYYPCFSNATLCSDRGTCLNSVCKCDEGWNGTYCEAAVVDSVVNKDSSSSSLGVILGVTIPVVVVVLLVLIIATVLIAYFVALGKKKEEWEIDHEEIELGPLLGSGGYGDVHMATWKGTEVVVKHLKPEVMRGREQNFATR